jgi:hypothetical protein
LSESKVNAEVLEILSRIPKGSPRRRAPVMVVNAKDVEGGERPLEWIEELDWKAYSEVELERLEAERAAERRRQAAAEPSA